MNHAQEHLEARVARLEAAVEHIEADTAEIKADIRQLRQDMRADFRLLFNTLLTVAIVLGGLILGLAGLMARGFNWL